MSKSEKPLTTEYTLNQMSKREKPLTTEYTLNQMSKREKLWTTEHTEYTEDDRLKDFRVFGVFRGQFPNTYALIRML
jgi:hypothetical protein